LCLGKHEGEQFSELFRMMTMRQRTMNCECICTLALVNVTGCATDKPDIPQAELREMLRESGATEGLTQEQIDQGCTVWGRKGPVTPGKVKSPTWNAGRLSARK